MRRLICSGLLLLASCADASAHPGGSIFSRLHGRLVAAHRGGYFGDPNTIEQFLKTMASGSADILEMDLRLTSDGVPVVFHDNALSQHSTCTGAVETTPIAALAHCTLADGLHIPRFDDVLKKIDGRVVLDAELKTDAVVAPAVKLILANNAEGWVYLQTQNSRSRYKNVRALSPTIPVIVKADDDKAISWVESLHDPYIVAVDIERDQLTPALVKRLHAEKKLVSEDAWRYQLSEERFSASCDRAFRLGADIAVTNDPVDCSWQKSTPLNAALGPFWWLDRPHVRHFWSSHSAAFFDVISVCIVALAMLSIFLFLQMRMLSTLSLKTFPGPGVGLKRFRFIARSLIFWRVNRQWLKFLAEPRMNQVVAANPAIYSKLARRFVSATFTQKERLLVIRQHYQFISGLSEQVRLCILDEVGFPILQLEHCGCLHLFRLIVARESSREGEMTLRWSIDSRRVADLTFVFCRSGESEPCLLIGGIQGGRPDEAPDQFRELTKAMHGLRPMPALIHVLRALAAALEIRVLVAVGDRNHVLGRKRALGRLHISYDRIWLESGAMAQADGNFFLPLATPVKDLAEVPSQKRAMYRRRYELMAAMNAGVLASVTQNMAVVGA